MELKGRLRKRGQGEEKPRQGDGKRKKNLPADPLVGGKKNKNIRGKRVWQGHDKNSAWRGKRFQRRKQKNRQTGTTLRWAMAFVLDARGKGELRQNLYRKRRWGGGDRGAAEKPGEEFGTSRANQGWWQSVFVKKRPSAVCDDEQLEGGLGGGRTKREKKKKNTRSAKSSS